MTTPFFNKKTMAAFLAALLLLLLLPAAALAQNDLAVSVDNETPLDGDKVEITLSLSGSGMAAAEGTFTYDAKMLAYDEGEGGVNDGYIALVSLEKGGANKLTARIVMKARREGSAEINFAIDKIINYKGETVGTAQAKVTLNIGPAPTVSEPAVVISYAQEGVKAENVQGAEGDMYVWRSIENVTVPSRYSESTYTYKGETVAAAIVEESDAPVLLYVTDDTGELGGYHIYDEVNDTLYPYQTIASVSKTYIILKPDGAVAVPDGFSPAKLTVDEKEYDAWTTADGEVYLVYARSPKGEIGFYIYNKEDSSLQRFSVLPARPLGLTLPDGDIPTAPVEKPDETPQPAQEAEKQQGGMSKIAFVAVCIAAGLLAVVLALVVVFNARREKLRRQRAARRRAQIEKGGLK